jgi:DNA-binding NarL/FixJ family response regulator
MYNIKDTRENQLPLVIRLSPDASGGPTFEDYAEKLAFDPIRMSNLSRLITFISHYEIPPTLVVIEHGFIEAIGDQIADFILTIKTIIRVRFPEHVMLVSVLIGEPITRSDVKRYRDAGISGLVPRTRKFNYNLSHQAFQALVHEKIEHWPKECVQKPVVEKRHKDEEHDGIDLTKRQTQVQQLLCERGLSNKAIAKQLNISESTVKIHVSAILKRYGVRNRTQLALAVNNGSRL